MNLRLTPIALAALLSMTAPGAVGAQTGGGFYVSQELGGHFTPGLGIDAHTADAPFTPHLVVPEARHFPKLAAAESRYPMTVIMADANTGTIQSLRYSTLSPGLSRQLQEATATLLHQPFSNEEYEEAVQRMYRQYPDPGAMLRLPPVIDLLGQ